MSQQDVESLLSFYLEHHMESLQRNDSSLMKLFKNSKFNDELISDRVLVNFDLMIGELERLVDENGSCEFSAKSWPNSWLWKVLCLNEKVSYENERIIRDKERERKDSDLARMGEWLLKNGQANSNEIFTANTHELYHILYVCAKGGSVDKVRVLLKYASDTSHFSKLRFYFESPISIAFRNGFLKVVKELCAGNYSELCELGWYEYMDGYEYTCLEMATFKDLNNSLDFFAEEYIMSRSENQSIMDIVTSLSIQYEDGEESNFIDEFEKKCNRLRNNFLLDKLISQLNHLTDLVVICTNE